MAAGNFPQAVIECLMKSKPKIERFRLKNKHINKAALQLTNFEKNEGRGRRKKKRHGQKKFGQQSKAKNEDTVATNSLNRMVLQAADKSKNTNTVAIQAADLSSDPVVANECLLQETADIRPLENNRANGKKNRKGIGENNSDDSVAVPCLKRKSDLLLTECESMDMGLHQLKAQRKESQKALNVGKDEKSEMSKKKSAEGMWRYNLSYHIPKPTTARRRMSVGGDWKVSDGAHTNLEVSACCDVGTRQFGLKIIIIIKIHARQLHTYEQNTKANC
jgi:hypothetical protein